MNDPIFNKELTKLEAVGSEDESLTPVDYPIDTSHEDLGGDPLVQAAALKVARAVGGMTAPMARAALSMAWELVESLEAINEINSMWEA